MKKVVYGRKLGIKETSLLNYIKSVWRKEASLFGFAEIKSSVLENVDLYREKTSDEIMNDQTYLFKDRGDREILLRPEITPQTASLVSSLKKENKFYPPLNITSIGDVFRYESEQYGRKREHTQFNADIFGIEGIEAEIELLTFFNHFINKLGIKSDIKILINDRKSVIKNINIWQEKNSISLKEDDIKSIFRSMDKKDKVEMKELEDILGKIIGKGNGKDKKLVADLLSTLENAEPSDEIKNICSSVQNTSFSPLLSRGFDYYDGVIFEGFSDISKRSIFGGGRYNGLVSSYGSDAVPAVGLGMGDVLLMEILKKEEKTNIENIYDILIVGENKSLYKDMIMYATYLRENNKKVLIDYTYENDFKKKVKKVDNKSIPYLLTLSESGVRLRNINKRDDTDISSPDDVLKNMNK